MDSLDIIVGILLSSCFALSGYALKKLCKMKCSSVKCCGFEIIRDLEREQRNNSNSSGNVISL